MKVKHFHMVFMICSSNMYENKTENLTIKTHFLQNSSSEKTFKFFYAIKYKYHIIVMHSHKDKENFNFNSNKSNIMYRTACNRATQKWCYKLSLCIFIIPAK